MLYHYIDETSQQNCGSWYASIGGALIEPEFVLNVEFDLLTTLKTFSTLTPVEIQSEFKYSEFFRGQTDERKIEILESLCETLAKIDITFLVGQAKCETRKMGNLIDIHGTPERAIQWLAFQNVANNLAPFTASGKVQTIVDLGVSESFKSLYDMYMGKWRGLLAVKQMEIDENQITIPNFRNLLPPLFIASHDSRVMQISDVLLGLLLAQTAGKLTNLKRNLLAATRVLENKIKVETVEWNKQ